MPKPIPKQTPNGIPKQTPKQTHKQIPKHQSRCFLRFFLAIFCDPFADREQEIEFFDYLQHLFAFLSFIHHICNLNERMWHMPLNPHRNEHQSTKQ